jgi:hypothetical protein
MGFGLVTDGNLYLNFSQRNSILGHGTKWGFSYKYRYYIGGNSFESTQSLSFLSRPNAELVLMTEVVIIIGLMTLPSPTRSHSLKKYAYSLQRKVTAQDWCSRTHA